MARMQVATVSDGWVPKVSAVSAQQGGSRAGRTKTTQVPATAHASPGTAAGRAAAVESSRQQEAPGTAWIQLALIAHHSASGSERELGSLRELRWRRGTIAAGDGGAARVAGNAAAWRICSGGPCRDIPVQASHRFLRPDSARPRDVRHAPVPPASPCSQRPICRVRARRTFCCEPVACWTTRGTTHIDGAWDILREMADAHDHSRPLPLQRWGIAISIALPRAHQGRIGTV